MARVLFCVWLVIFSGITNAKSVSDEPIEINPIDPWESTNRKIYQFNDVIDRNVLKPTAQFYQKYSNKSVRIGISNFVSNLNNISVIVNDILQFKLWQSLQDTARLAINSTVGILGIFDVASEIGLNKYNADFGQTLAVWGVGTGPYIVLPLLGPSSGRNLTARLGTLYASSAQIDNVYYTRPLKNINHNSVELSVQVINLINFRATLLGAEKMLDSISLDRYATIRDIYLQHRDYLVNDGKIDASAKSVQKVEYKDDEEGDAIDAMLEEDEDL